MAVDFTTGIPVASGFSLKAQAPLDVRRVVDTIADRDSLIGLFATYEGMMVYVKEDATTYIRTDADPSGEDYSACWVQMLATGGSGGDTSEAVLTTGNQSIAGVKTFTQSPVVPTPTEDNQAVNKGYVDATAQGLAIKDPVRAASFTNLEATYAPGTAGVGATLTGTAALPAIDGVTLEVGDRVLVAGQTNAAENGIYVVTTAETAFVLTRAEDFDNSDGGEIKGGAFCFVQEGTAYADCGFVCTTDGDITVGTTEIHFTQFSGAGQITAGAGLAKDGNTLSIASTYAGQASITTVGTITTGTWNGTTIAIANGGTGATNAEGAFANLAPAGTTAGDVMYYNGTKWTALAKGEGVLVADDSGLRYQTTLAAGTF